MIKDDTSEAQDELEKRHGGGLNTLKRGIVLRQIDSGKGERKRKGLLLSSRNSTRPSSVSPTRAFNLPSTELQPEDNNNNNNININVNINPNENTFEDEEDSSSLATTTSDVNSDDDAASIASRLSQIVVEQEEKLFYPATNKWQQQLNNQATLTQSRKNMTQLIKEPAPREKQKVDQASSITVGNNHDKVDETKNVELTRHNSLESDTENTKQQQQQGNSSGSSSGSDCLSCLPRASLPEICVVKDFDQKPPRLKKIAADGKIPIPKLKKNPLLDSRERAKSVVESGGLIIRMNDQIYSYADDTKSKLQYNIKRNESCTFLPERGDLRRLGSARRNSAANAAQQQQQQQQQQPQTTEPTALVPVKTQLASPGSLAGIKDQLPIVETFEHRHRSNTTGSRDRCNLLGTNDELILNIRRSAWTLSDFDQTFNKLESGSNKSIELGGGGSKSPSERSISSDLNELKVLEKINNNLQNNLNSCTNNTSLLILASKNAAVTLTQQQQQLQQQQQQNSHGSLAATPAIAEATGGATIVLVDKENLASLNCPTTNEDCYRRPSFAPSVASFADSVDSFNIYGSDVIRDSDNKHVLNQHQNHQDEVVTSEIRKRKNICIGGGGGGDGRGGGASNGQGKYSGKYGNINQSEDDGRCCGISKYCTLSKVSSYFPILHWLPVYSLSNLWGDLTGGIAVAVLNISTSMSAAVVAGTDFGVAFRASIVNTLVYSLLCSSRHTSFGSWSIMSQMLLVSVRRALSDELILARLNMGSSATWDPEEYEKWHLNIIIMYTFLIGVIQFVCGLLNLGNILASFIPEALCSSMITATAFTMAIGQLANMCGTSNRVLWSIERNTTELWADLKNAPVDITDLFAGLFRWIQQIALLIKYNEQINLICVLISIVTVILLYLNQYVIQKQLEKLFKRKVFIPSEMIILVVMIIISSLLSLKEVYNVTTCGPIHIDFMIPTLPNLKLVRELWFDSVATALISYTMVYVMAKTYSNKFNYEVDCNQELIACGAGNLIGGLFDALPATASFTRTAGQVEAGGQTQMASIINCLLLIILAQLLGPYVATLPVCVMAATLFFGFVKMMSRFTEVFMYWRVCKVDFSIWMVTFIAILTLDIVNGFVYGFIFSILTMLYRAQNRRCYMLGSIGTSDVYVPLVKYPLAEEIDGIKIFQFCGPIHYVCAELFERLLRHKTRVDVKQIWQLINEQEVVKFNPRDLNLPTHIILDFSMISYIDSAGIHTIKKIIADYQRVNITILLASLASHVAAVVKSEPSLWNVYKNRFYVTLADAVHCATRDSRLLLNRDQSVKVIVNT